MKKQNNYMVSIIPEAKSLWFRVPKAGKTSLKDQLQLHFPKSRKFPMGHLDLDDPKFEGWFRFAFVRPPIRRFLAVYNYLVVVGNRHGIYLPKDEKYLNVNYLVDYAIESENPHFLPQSKLIPEKIDFIGRFEAFETEVKRLFKHLGKDVAGAFHHNKVDYIGFLDLEVRSIRKLNEYYAEDYERFGNHFTKQQFKWAGNGS